MIRSQVQPKELPMNSEDQYQVLLFTHAFSSEMISQFDQLLGCTMLCAISSSDPKVCDEDYQMGY